MSELHAEEEEGIVHDLVAHFLHGLNQIQIIHHKTIHTSLDLQQLQPERWEKIISRRSMWVN